MSRLVLLGFNDNEVDVLTRVTALQPRPQVLVAHPDPEALILYLAEISELETGTGPPEPRPDDLLVIPEARREALAEWIEPFRRMGVRIIPPSALGTGTPVPRDEASPPEPGPAKASAPKPESPERNAPDPGREKRNGPPAEVFIRPEATFRYLIENALGKNASATLWWEGLENLWVPLLWPGDAPGNSTARVDLSSPFGRFGMTDLGAEHENQELLDAFTRVAEDVALRDLARWDRKERELSGLGVPREPAAIEPWAVQILETLEPETAWLWRRAGEEWSSIRTWGKGVSLEGRLTLGEDLLENMFREGRWVRWSPSESVRMQMVFSPEDHQWKLRMERVKRALERKAS